MIIANANTAPNDSIILDFFSGSATTAHAVMQLNAEDGGHRKFIMVQLPEACDEKSEAYKAGYKNICEIGKERIRRAGRKIKEEAGLTAQDLDIGFRVLRLDSSNMQDVYYTPAAMAAGSLLDITTDNIKPDRTPEDLLFQVMLELGVLPSSTIVETVIDGKAVFDVADGFLLACFDSGVTTETVTAIAKRAALLRRLPRRVHGGRQHGHQLRPDFRDLFALNRKEGAVICEQRTGSGRAASSTYVGRDELTQRQ